MIFVPFMRAVNVLCCKSWLVQAASYFSLINDPLLEIKPAVSMIDQKVAITVFGQNVTLRALLVSDNGKTFQSRAFYIVDKLGRVLVKSEPSVGVDYTGIEPMGLMWYPGYQRQLAC